jgi:hypothetical protein
VDSTCTLRIAVARLQSCCQNVPHMTLSHRPAGNYHIFWISPSIPRDSIGSSAYSLRNRCGCSVICYRACKVPDLLRSTTRCGVLVRATEKHGSCQPYKWDVSLAGRGLRTSRHGTSLRLPSHTEFLVALKCYCHQVTTQLQLVVIVVVVVVITRFVSEEPSICTFLLRHFYEIITEIGQKNCFRACPESTSHDIVYVH